MNLASESVTVEYDPAQTSPQALAEAVKKAGYELVLPPPPQQVELPVLGMSCANCAAAVQRTLQNKVPGVIRASVNFASERASVTLTPRLTSLAALARRLKTPAIELVLPAARARR